MKLSIAGIEYDYKAALDKGTLGVLYELKTAGGPGRRAVAEALNLFDSGLKREAEETDEQAAARAAEMEDDPRVLIGLAGLIFISKRHAGEAVTWSEAQSFGWSDIQFVIEDSDIKAAQAAENPPMAPGDQTAPGAESQSEPNSQPAKRSKTTSKTSKPRSTPTS